MKYDKLRGNIEMKEKQEMLNWKDRNEGKYRTWQPIAKPKKKKGKL